MLNWAQYNDWQELIDDLLAGRISDPEACDKIYRGLMQSYEYYPENTLMMLKDYGLTDIKQLSPFLSSICNPTPVALPDFDPNLVNPRAKILSDKQWQLIKTYWNLFQLAPSWPTHPLVLVDDVGYLPPKVTITKGLYQIPTNWWSNIIPEGEWTDIAYILNPKQVNYRPINPTFLKAYYRDIIRNWDTVITSLHPYFTRLVPDWDDRSLQNYRHWAFITKLLSQINVLTYPYQEVLAEHLFQFSFTLKALPILYLYYLNPSQTHRVTEFLRQYINL